MTQGTAGVTGRGVALTVSAALLALGAVLLVWALTNQQGTPPTPDSSVGLSAAQQQDTEAATTPAPSEPAPTEDAPAEDAPAEDAATSTGAQDTATSTGAEAEAEQGATPEPTEEQIAALPASEPVSVDIPTIDVSSPLHPLGLNEDGSLAVPSGERYDEAAWYDGSPTPGELGPSVIEGHVTSQGSTPSVFFDLGALTPGDTVDVTREDGSTATFVVYATDTFPKDEFPKAAVYGNTEVPELRLITCGGDYDADNRRHVDNIVVFARMVDTA